MSTQTLVGSVNSSEKKHRNETPRETKHLPKRLGAWRSALLAGYEVKQDKCALPKRGR